jgi:hypothetical protein
MFTKRQSGDYGGSWVLSSSGNCWTTIPAIVLSVDDQHAELIAIDAKLIREELTPSERDELRRRRREISAMIYRQNQRRKDGGQAQGREKQQEGSVPAADTPPKMERTRLTILHSAPIDTEGRNGAGDDRSGLGDLAPLGSKAPRAFIPRLITRLFGIEDTQQSPPWPVLSNKRMAPMEVKPKGMPSHGQRNEGKARKGA